MNKKIKKLWVDALNSDKYEQGCGYLKDNLGRFCCLGVLADVNPQPCSLSSHYLPPEYAEKVFGKKGQDIQAELALMNDNGVPFPMIAGFIQENL